MAVHCEAIFQGVQSVSVTNSLAVSRESFFQTSWHSILSSGSFFLYVKPIFQCSRSTNCSEIFIDICSLSLCHPSHNFLERNQYSILEQNLCYIYLWSRMPQLIYFLVQTKGMMVQTEIQAVFSLLSLVLQISYSTCALLFMLHLLPFTHFQ